MNESMLADIHGNAPVSPPKSRLSPEAHDFFYAINGLYSSVRRFSVLEKMFRRYPWRGVVSKAEPLQSVYYLFVHECYVFEERLGKLLSTAASYSSAVGLPVELKQSTKEIMRQNKRVFGSFVRMRGQHIHQDEFLPRDVRRIGLLESMSFAYGARDADARKVWGEYHDLVAAEVRKTWLGHCVEARKSSEQLAILAFRQTRPLWMRLSQE